MVLPLLEHGEDVVLTHDHVLFAIEVDLRAGVLAEEDLVALLDVERRDVAVLVDLAVADGDNFAFLRLFFGSVGNDDPARGR